MPSLSASRHLTSHHMRRLGPSEITNRSGNELASGISICAPCLEMSDKTHGSWTSTCASFLISYRSDFRSSRPMSFKIDEDDYRIVNLELWGRGPYHCALMLAAWMMRPYFSCSLRRCAAKSALQIPTG